MLRDKIFRWPELCEDCQARESRRRCRKEKKEQLQQRLDRLLAPLVRKSHLRKIAPLLREKMLHLPAGKGLLLYGPPGVGKSYAMCALMRHYAMKNFSILRISYDDLCLEIRDTYANGKSEKMIIKRFREPDKLLIEDVGTSVGTGAQETDFSLRTFLLILDYRLEHCKPTFITTNKSVEELGRSFDQRVASRLRQACEIILVSGRDRRTNGLLSES